jgi:tRNA(Ile)-lysidine synthase
MHPEPVSLESAFVEAWPPDQWRDLHVVLAVSGGPDSVALFRAATAVKKRVGGSGQIHVAHLNHLLRPAEAAADQAWLAELCDRHAVRLEVGITDVEAIAVETGDGLEAAARVARYRFLRTVADKVGARFVAVGHTANDQVETVLHRFIRGTGISGLVGMPKFRPLSSTVTLIRPLIGVSRTDVLAYLTRLSQDYRVDATNNDPRFTRNRLRHNLLPAVRSDFNSNVDAAILRLAGQAGETQEVISALAGELLASCARVSLHRVVIDCQRLSAEPSLLVRETCKLAWTAAGWPLQDMGFHHWQHLAELVAGDSAAGPLTLPGNVVAERCGTTLEFSDSM